MSRQSYAGIQEPFPLVATNERLGGNKLELTPRPQHNLDNQSNTFTNLDGTFKDRIKSVSVPAHMQVRFDTWTGNNKNELTQVLDGATITADGRFNNGVSAVVHNAENRFCMGSRCVGSADSYGVVRQMDWKPFVVKCCSGASGGIINSKNCGDFWNGENKALCDPVMKEWCKKSSSYKPTIYGEETAGRLGGPMEPHKFEDEKVAQRTCNAFPACKGITKTREFTYEMRASSEVTPWTGGEWSLAKVDAGSKDFPFVYD